MRVSNKWVPARPHSARRWGAEAIPSCAFIALIVAAGFFSNVWRPEKWSATDLHTALDPLTTQDTKTNPNTSFTAPQNVAAGGDPMAEWKLGRMYADGDGVARDDVRAFEYFSRIANAHANDSPSAPQAQIVANAFVALGRYYLNGIPNSKIKPDTERAREMFSYAASYFGDADAQYRLGRLYLDGTPSDPHQAARWFQLAATKGDCRAEAVLGDLLFQGRNVPRQAARGLMWLTLSKDCAGSEETWVKPLYDNAFHRASEDERAMALVYLEDWLKGRRE